MSDGQGSLFDKPENAATFDGGGLKDGPLGRLMDDNFIRYASYVIRDRAIPDLADGLKPVQRRILHSLHENDDGKFIKVANIVGHTMQYHPHGDASIGDALVTLVNKGLLIEGQGNFGNVLTGDPAAAARYIECRLTDLARNHLFQNDLTQFSPSYDGRRKEPVSLPSRLPLLLMMGADGIAVGLSTRVLPHNFIELLEAQIAILDKKPFTVVPDFRQGGLMDAAEYENGTGRVRVRSRIDRRGDDALVVRSVPPTVTTDSLIASIETAAKKKSLKLKAINDFTAENVEIEILLAADQDPEKTIQWLYAFTQCEVALASRIVVIDRERPVEMNLEQVLKANTRTLVKTLRRQLEARNRDCLARLHHLTLVQLFVEERVYKRIEECTSYPAVQKAVLDGVSAFRKQLRRDVTGKDVEMLLGIKIKKISRYDMDKNRKEIGDLEKELLTIEKHLEAIVPYTKRYLRSLIREFAATHPRRTEIQSFDTIEKRDLTASELTLQHDAEKGYVGHGIEGAPVLTCSSLDKVLVVFGDGRYKVMTPPEKLFVEGLQHCDLL
ncbi:MAG: DNA topoisomerase IV subunit A, partial [Acidobacteriota bacterium]|nr:DNA topoisomerase IV subunit A [Acidobacteriota bacterium]